MLCWNIRKYAGLLAVLAVSTTSWPSYAAHPLQTEDTGTQGAGNVEFENGLSRMHDSSSSVFQYQPQLSYGLRPTLDLIVQPSWISRHEAGSAVVHGWGDTNLDAKWRFFGTAPWSFATRAGLSLPTSQKGLGLAQGRTAAHLLLVATYDAEPYTVHANLGWIHNPDEPGQRQDLGHVSAAFMWAVNERLTLTVDGGADASADASSHAWPGVMLAGAIYTLRPGLDVDIGYQSSVYTTPASRNWLIGLTYRFAP